MTQDLENAIEILCQFWLQKKVPSRDLLLHNVVVQKNRDGIVRLVVIDGLGTAGVIPFRLMPNRVKICKIQKKVDNIHQRVQLLLSQRGESDFPGYHGLLIHNDSP